MEHNKCGEELYDATKPQRTPTTMCTPHFYTSMLWLQTNIEFDCHIYCSAT